MSDMQVVWYWLYMPLYQSILENQKFTTHKGRQVVWYGECMLSTRYQNDKWCMENHKLTTHKGMQRLGGLRTLLN